jgi:hypothetical protein
VKCKDRNRFAIGFTINFEAVGSAVRAGRSASVKPNWAWFKKYGRFSALFVVGGTLFYILLVRIGFVMPFAEMPAVFCGNFCPSESPIHSLPTNDRPLNPTQPLQVLLKDADKSKVSILVEKSKYRLTVFYQLQPVKSYAIVLGSNPTGDKRSQGDKKTPEGIFRIRDRYPHPDWSRFIWLNYPTGQSWRKHFQAKLAGKLSWFLPIGDEIGIHGVPNGGDHLIDQRT